MLLAYNPFVSYVESDGDSETHLVLLSKFDTYICIPPANTSWNTAQYIHHCPVTTYWSSSVPAPFSLLRSEFWRAREVRGQLDLVEDNHTVNSSLRLSFRVCYALCASIPLLMWQPNFIHANSGVFQTLCIRYWVAPRATKPLLHLRSTSQHFRVNSQNAIPELTTCIKLSNALIFDTFVCIAYRQITYSARPFATGDIFSSLVPLDILSLPLTSPHAVRVRQGQGTSRSLSHHPFLFHSSRQGTWALASRRRKCTTPIPKRRTMSGLAPHQTTGIPARWSKGG